MGTRKCRIYEKPGGRGYIAITSDEEETPDELMAEMAIVEMLMAYGGGDRNGGSMDPFN